MENCLITKLKAEVNAELPKLGEATITAMPNKVLTIKWSGFNQNIDKVRIISGTGTIESTSGGYVVTAGAAGCVIGASEKYRIYQISSTGTEVAFVINAEDFSYRSTPLTNISRAKIIGNVTPMFANHQMGWFEYFDLSEAYGILPVLPNMVILMSDTPAPNVQLSFSDTLTAILLLVGSFKTSDMPITYIANSSTLQRFFDAVGNNSVNLVGNISDLGILPEIIRINVNGSELVGDLGNYIASLASKSSGAIRFLNTDKSGMSIHGITMAGNNDFAGVGVLATFDANSIVVKYKDDAKVLGTYNKSTQTWTWNV